LRHKICIAQIIAETGVFTILIFLQRRTSSSCPTSIDTMLWELLFLFSGMLLWLHASS